MSKGTNTILLAVVAVLVGAFLCNGSSATSAKSVAPRSVPTPEKSLFTEYRGVKIGMATADVRTKLGKAKDQSDAQDQYIFSDNESALFYYDAAKNVNAIMITFTGDVSKAPTAKDIFGDDSHPMTRA